ncbi:MAG: hypothetical protein AB1324_07815 [Candidatus Micrarchaeota archaeon]
MNTDVRAFIAILPLLLRMKRHQWKGREALEKMQEEKLASLLRHASENVPHYRKSLRGLRFRGLDSLPSLPLVSREDLRDTRSFVSARHQKLHNLATSGSSGNPISACYDMEELWYKQALRYFMYGEAGLGLFEERVWLTYRDYGQPSMLQALGIYRSRYLSFLDHEAKNLARLKAIRPTALLSYPSLLIPLARENIEGGHGFGVRLAFSSAELLTDWARKLITESFGCSLRNRYGAVETGSLAWECEKGSLHAYSDSLIMEIVDENGEPVKEGKSGEIVVTPLWRRSMPLIRYRMGDRAAFGPPCPCGRGLRTLKGLKGRSNDPIVLPSGREFWGTMLDITLRGFRDILSFQGVQEEPGRLRLSIVRRESAPGPDAEDIRRAINAAFPEPLEIEVEFVDGLERRGDGKICDFVSKIKR